MTTPNKQQFDTALATFIAGCLRIHTEHMTREYPKTAALWTSAFSTEPGRRYVRIVRRDYGQSSVHCFVDTTNGDVLKAAGWSAPAKHARGNIFDHHNGLLTMGEYGPAYLR